MACAGQGFSDMLAISFDFALEEESLRFFDWHTRRAEVLLVSILALNLF